MANFNAHGQWDDAAPDFTPDDIARAVGLRRQARWTPQRHDQCPHPVACANVPDCLDKIAWYLRHQRAIEAAIADGDTEGYQL